MSEISHTEREMLSILDAKEQGRAYQTYEIRNISGQFTVFCETNDDNDDGWPDGEIIKWAEPGFRSLSDALRRTGVSRFGISGVAVIVIHRGHHIMLGDDLS